MLQPYFDQIQASQQIIAEGSKQEVQRLKSIADLCFKFIIQPQYHSNSKINRFTLLMKELGKNLWLSQTSIVCKEFIDNKTVYSEKNIVVNLAGASIINLKMDFLDFIVNKMPHALYQTAGISEGCITPVEQINPIFRKGNNQLKVTSCLEIAVIFRRAKVVSTILQDEEFNMIHIIEIKSCLDKAKEIYNINKYDEKKIINLLENVFTRANDSFNNRSSGSLFLS